MTEQVKTRQQLLEWMQRLHLDFLADNGGHEPTVTNLSQVIAIVERDRNLLEEALDVADTASNDGDALLTRERAANLKTKIVEALGD